MKEFVRIDELEAAINRCRGECLGNDLVLPLDARHMADIYGTMLYERLNVIELERFSPASRAALLRWLCPSV